MTSVDSIAELDKQISDLKEERNKLIRAGSFDAEELKRILSFRTPKRTLCQLLRELHDVTDGEERAKVDQCLLIAKKMDAKLMEYAGRPYAEDWYDEEGKFIGGK